MSLTEAEEAPKDIYTVFPLFLTLVSVPLFIPLFMFLLAHLGVYKYLSSSLANGLHPLRALFVSLLLRLRPYGRYIGYGFSATK